MMEMEEPKFPTDNAHPSIPAWLENGMVIGANADGELLAVGEMGTSGAWLIRKRHDTGTWVSMRGATIEEIARYDAEFLKLVYAYGEDSRVL